MNKFEMQLDTALSEYENFKPCKQYSIEWICNRIDWCWKWRKISVDKKDEFCDRIIDIMEGDL